MLLLFPLALSSAFVVKGSFKSSLCDSFLWSPSQIIQPAAHPASSSRLLATFISNSSCNVSNYSLNDLLTLKLRRPALFFYCIFFSFLWSVVSPPRPYSGEVRRAARSATSASLSSGVIYSRCDKWSNPRKNNISLLLPRGQQMRQSTPHTRVCIVI